MIFPSSSLADASLRFIGVAVGAYSRQGHAGLFRESAMEHHLYEGHVHIPPARPQPCTAEPSLPMVFMVDEAFGLVENLMRQ